jgi:hypothetical protein
MQDELFFEGVRYISASQAASLAEITRDHVGRLCKSGKIIGRKVGRSWYIAENSLQAFIVLHRHAKSLRAMTLAKERKSEYEMINRSLQNTSTAKDTINVTEQLSHAMSGPAGVSHAALSLVHVPIYTIAPLFEFAHKLLALTLAIVITFGAYTFFEPHQAIALITGMKIGMKSEINIVSNIYKLESPSTISNYFVNIGQDARAGLAAVSISITGGLDHHEREVSSTSDGVSGLLHYLPNSTAPITTPEIDTQKLCVGTICITQTQFLKMVQLISESQSTFSTTSFASKL